MSWTINGKNLDPVTRKTESWELDLSVLARGKAGPSGFRGRPSLTLRLLPGFRAMHRSGAKSSAQAERSRLQWLLRFLDSCEALSAAVSEIGVLRIEDLDWHEVEALWPRYLAWLLEQPFDSAFKVARAAHAALQASHEIALREGATSKSQLLTYNLPTDSRKGAYGDDPITYEEGGRLFRMLAATWRTALKRIAAGRASAGAGSDPRTGSSGKNRWEGSPWDSVQNRLWLLVNAHPFGPLIDVETARGRTLDGYAGRSPGMATASEPDGGTGLLAHVPWVYLTIRELAVAFAMVCLKSGMSPDAVARMRVKSWYKADPLHPGERVVLFGPKRIPGKLLRASSSVRRLTDAYQVIQKVIELTEPLRRRARVVAARTGDRALARAAELIWIWPTGRGLGHALPGTSTLERMNGILNGLVTSRGLRRDSGAPLHFRLGEARSIWAAFVFHRSGYNATLTAKTLGHSDLRSLLHYLETREARRRDRARLIDLQGRVITGLRDGRYDPASYVERPAVARSVMGLPCGNPADPAPEADPGHRPGRLCARQRCWLCHQWYATIESLPYLIRIRLDVEAIGASLALALWETSDYPDMLAFCAHVVGRFHADHVEAATRVATSMPAIVIAAPGALPARAA